MLETLRRRTSRTRWLGRVDYCDALVRMQRFTDKPCSHYPNALWLLEHEAVFTLGQAGQIKHLLKPGPIQVVQSDRGGQVTYHGPGQLIVYTLLDLHALGSSVKVVVFSLEQIVIDYLRENTVEAQRKTGAPGVYVDEKKIAALGLRVRRGRCYHGLAVNVAMDLEPFTHINPCGYPSLQVTQMSDLGIDISPRRLGEDLTDRLIHRLSLNDSGRA